MTKAADIMVAALREPHKAWCSCQLMACDCGHDARAIVTAVNLFPLYEAVREAAEAARRTAEPDDDFDGAFIEYLVDAGSLDRLRSALDALQAAEDAL